MGQIEINRKNYEQFMKSLKALGADLDDVAKRVVTKAAKVALTETKNNTPVKSGWLRKGWQRYKTIKVGRSFVSGYRNSVEYGLYVNNGHRILNKSGETVGYQPAEGMLEKGITRGRRSLESLFREEVRKAKQKGRW